MTPRTDRGGATVLVVAMAGLLMFVMTGLAAAGGLVTAQRQAQAAADLAALAGASDLPDACTAAGDVAAANAATLETCLRDGDEVTARAVAGRARDGGRPGRTRVTNWAVGEGDLRPEESPSRTAGARVVRPSRVERWTRGIPGPWNPRYAPPAGPSYAGRRGAVSRGGLPTRAIPLTHRPGV